MEDDGNPGKRLLRRFSDSGRSGVESEEWIGFRERTVPIFIEELH